VHGAAQVPALQTWPPPHWASAWQRIDAGGAAGAAGAAEPASAGPGAADPEDGAAGEPVGDAGGGFGGDPGDPAAGDAGLVGPVDGVAGEVVDVVLAADPVGGLPPPGVKSGGTQASPTLQSRSSVQLRLPGRVVPIGSGGAFGGGRMTVDPVARVGEPWVGGMGPLHAASASASRAAAKRMRERYQIAGFARRLRAAIDSGGADS